MMRDFALQELAKKGYQSLTGKNKDVINEWADEIRPEITQYVSKNPGYQSFEKMAEHLGVPLVIARVAYDPTWFDVIHSTHSYSATKD